jgi:DNA replication and repair protein RecF
MARLSSLSLTNFRSYSTADLSGFHSRFVAFIGANGMGKTNLLEAISLLSPGKGLRGASVLDMARVNSNAPWGVSAKLKTTAGDILLGTGGDDSQSRRAVYIQGVKAKSQTELADYVRAVWLTPQMDRLFLDPATTRRKFLDRLVFTYDAAHAGRMRRYETALSNRSRLLKDGQQSGAWIDSLEAQMAEAASAIAASRVDFILKLQAEIDLYKDDNFPQARLELDGETEKYVHSKPSLQIEDELKSAWRNARAFDAVQGGSSIGVHRTDLNVFFADKNMPAHLSSTGEQKFLLIGIILAHAAFIARDHGAPPLILLDEVAAHLDEGRRCALYQKLYNLGGQIFLTGTDMALFNSMPEGQKFHVSEGGQITL